MRPRGGDYCRRLNSYYHHGREDNRWRSMRYDRGRDVDYRYYDSNISNRDRNSYYHRKVNVFYYPRNRRYYDRRFNDNDRYFNRYRYVNDNKFTPYKRYYNKDKMWIDNKNDVRYSRGERFRDSRSNNKYIHRRSSDKIKNFFYSRNDKYCDDKINNSRHYMRHHNTKSYDNNYNLSNDPLKLHIIFLENLSNLCTATDLMRYAKGYVGIPDFIEAFGDGKGIIGFYDRKKFDKMKLLLENVKTIPIENGEVTKLTVIKKETSKS